MDLVDNAQAHIALAVRDVNRSLRFYCDVLGFQVLKKVSVGANKVKAGAFAAHAFSFTTVTKGPFAIKLVTIEPEAPSSAGLVDDFLGLRYLGFKVADFDSTIASLKAQGVQFLSPPLIPTSDDPAPKLVFFRDPDGNLLEIGG